MLVKGLPALLERLGAIREGTTAFGQTSVIIGSSLSYAGFVHDGTAPHIIQAHGGGLFWEGAAHPVMLVHHPGYKGNPFLTNAVDATRDTIVEMVSTAVGAVAEGGPGTLIPEAMRAGEALVLDAARETVNVKTGALRDSLHSEVYQR